MFQATNLTKMLPVLLAIGFASPTRADWDLIKWEDPNNEDKYEYKLELNINGDIGYSQVRVTKDGSRFRVEVDEYVGEELIDSDSERGRLGATRIRIDGSSASEEIAIDDDITNMLNVIVFAGGGPDAVSGGTHVFGEGGDDFLSSGVEMYGGDGLDRIYSGSSTHYLNGGFGNDRLDASGAGGLSQELHGGAGNDLLIGSDEADNITGGGGRDRIYGRGGDDTIFGEASSTIYTPHPDGDLILGEGGNDTIDGGGGDDMILGGPGHDTIRGGTELDWIVGADGMDWLDPGPYEGIAEGVFGLAGADVFALPASRHLYYEDFNWGEGDIVRSY